jgi:hypothetical protein
LDKIVCTFTDNASNFKKAFVEFCIVHQLMNDDDSNDDDDSHDPDDPQLVGIACISANGTDNDDSDDYIHLPIHHKCVCHSLNLIATTDADKALQTQAYSKIYHTSSGKIQAIWNAVHRTTKAADSISDIYKGKKLSVPCPTRWNSRFDAVQRLLEFRYQLGQICDILQVPKLKQPEIDFLSEYISVMEPLAVTLDQLQGDQNCFNGMLLPKLVQLRRQLNVYAGEQLIYCTPLVKCILTGLETRYNSMFNFDLSVPEAKDAIFAEVSIHSLN